MRKVISTLIVLLMLTGIMAVPAAAQQSDWEIAKNRALDRIRAEVVPSPLVGSVGGEWTVLALARAGRITADDPWLSGWFADLDSLLAQVDATSARGYDISNPPTTGTFPSELRRWTDFQRVTLALGALGINASDYNGHDLTAVYGTFTAPAQRHALNQTINVDTFALIALDTGAYSGERDRFIQSILDSQRANGTWSLNPAAATSPLDLDITAMALQALAPYYARGDVRVTNAVNSALGWLRAQTFPDVESTAQMIVALTALGPDFGDEASYYVSHLLRWFDPQSGGFRRPAITDLVNLMATEQAAYGLVAYWRFRNNMTSLYNMSDVLGGALVRPVPPIGELPGSDADGFGLPGRHADVKQSEIVRPGRTFADIQNHASRTAMEALAARGIINGMNETEFAPNATVTRAQFATIVTQALGLPARAEASAAFGDVSTGAWFAATVGSAYYYDIVRGIQTPDGLTFNPSGTITRQEAAIMVARAAALSGMDTALTDTETLNILAMFGDYRSAARWAWNYLAFCFREGILDDAEFYIEPLAAITRGEIAEMVYRLLVRAELLVS